MHEGQFLGVKRVKTADKSRGAKGDPFESFAGNGRELHGGIGFKELAVFEEVVNRIGSRENRKTIDSTKPKFVVFKVDLYRSDGVSVLEVVGFDDRDGGGSRCTDSSIRRWESFLGLAVVLFCQGLCSSFGNGVLVL